MLTLRSALLLTLALFVAAPAYAQEDAELSAEEIIDRALDTNTVGFQTGEVTMSLVIQDESGQSRERQLQIRGAGGDDDASRALVRVISPPAQAGQSYLFRENPDAEDDVYVFLPALDDAPRRISGSQKNNSFMGTHFTYADLETRDIRDATYARRDDESIGRFDVYVIDATPTETEDYARVRLWIRQSDFIPLRIRYFDADGEETKTMFTEETATSDSGEVYVRRLTLRPAEGGATTMIIDEANLDVEISDAEFTPQNLVQ